MRQLWWILRGEKVPRVGCGDVENPSVAKTKTCTVAAARKIGERPGARTEDKHGSGEKQKKPRYLVSIAKGCEGWKIATLFQNPTYGVCCTGPKVKKHCLFHTICPRNLLFSTLLLGSQQIPSRGVVIMSAAEQHWGLTLAFIQSLAAVASPDWAREPRRPIASRRRRAKIRKPRAAIDNP